MAYNKRFNAVLAKNPGGAKLQKGLRKARQPVRITEINSCLYELSDKLGEGGFGTVYAGRRLTDGLKVAVKIVKKANEVCVPYINIPDHPDPIPLEIALQILVNKGPRVPQIIQMLDWEDLPDLYVMVLEHIPHCKDVFEYLCYSEGNISEDEAKFIIWHTTQAASVCVERGVFHRDIKLDNILINTETMEVKLIDFGCGELLKSTPYRTYAGTRKYCCPEFMKTGSYYAKPATVYSIGMMLFIMIFGRFPTNNDHYRINKNTFYKPGVSKDCCLLIQACLQDNPLHRLDLNRILLSKWFKSMEEKILQTSACALQSEAVITETCPGNTETNSANTGNHPVEAEIHPVEAEIHPVKDEIRPVEPEIRPVEPEIRPVEPEIRPVEPEIRPVEPEIRPVEAEIHPVETETPSLPKEKLDTNEKLTTEGCSSLSNDVPDVKEGNIIKTSWVNTMVWAANKAALIYKCYNEMCIM